jgi:hypothetical protein
MFHNNRDILTCTADTDIIRLNGATNTVIEFIRSGAVRKNAAGQYYVHDNSICTASVRTASAPIAGEGGTGAV